MITHNLSFTSNDTSRIERLISLIKKNGAYIVGKNEDSVRIKRFFKVNGVIDDTAEVGQKWMGLKVFKMMNLDKDSVVINCSTSISPVSVIKNLKEKGFNRILSYSDIVAFDDRLIPPHFVNEMKKSFKLRQNEWENLYKILADEESRKVFKDVISFRLTANPSYMFDYKVRLNEQYFEKFMEINEEIFVDIGGFDGDTSLEFISRYPNYKKVLFFEPSNLNMLSAKQRLNSFDRIEYYNCGLSNKNQKLRFNEGKGSSSSINDDGDQIIEVKKLDNILKEQISYLKMDIEGWEINALKGAEKSINLYQPKMAIAVYNSADDFLDIYKLVNSFYQNVKIYLRHYTEGWSETIMYFKPVGAGSNEKN